MLSRGKVVYISEPGLYQLIFSSRLETAEKFRSSPLVTKPDLKSLIELSTCVDHEGKTMLFYGFGHKIMILSKCLLYWVFIISRTRYVFPTPVGPENIAVCGCFMNSILFFGKSHNLPKNLLLLQLH